VRVAETGDMSIGAGNDQQRGADLALSEEITLPVTLLILLVVFGAVLAAGVPLLLALSAIAASVGLSAVFSVVVPDAGVGAEVIILMGMAVGVDYSLFYLKREREERRRSGGAVDHATAVRLAAATSGRAVMVSAAGVVLCTACLYAAGDVIFASLATATIVVVLVAMVSSLTVLPAALAKLGPRVDRPRVPLVGRLTGREQGRVWPVLLRPATRRPLLTLVLATAALLALAAPALGMRLNEPGRSTFSREIPAVATYHRMVESFPAQAADHLVVVRAGAADATRVVIALDAVARQAQADRAFGGVTEPAVAASTDGRTHTLTLHVPYDPTSSAADRSLRLLRGMLPARVGAVPGATYAVSGDVAHNSDYVTSQADKTPLVVALVMLMTFVMMLVAFRSVLIGLIAVALNLLSAVAAFGVLAAVFQPRWAEGLLGFTSTGFISARVPLFLFVILFGLSMDYQIFVVSRIREHVQRGLDARAVVERGITGSAGVITSAAVVMVSVFISFMFLHLLEVKQTGFALAVAVLVDAAVVRILILPALLTLLGRASWWPSPLSGRPRSVPPGPEATRVRPSGVKDPTT
jgi:RND superfamily putative drug exporter